MAAPEDGGFDENAAERIALALGEGDDEAAAGALEALAARGAGVAESKADDGGASGDDPFADVARAANGAADDDAAEAADDDEKTRKRKRVKRAERALARRV